MRADHVDAEIEQLWDEAASKPVAAFVESLGLQRATPTVQAQWERVQPDVPLSPPMSLGLARQEGSTRSADNYQLYVEVRTAEEADVFKRKFGKDADVVVVPESFPRPAPAFYRKKHTRLQDGIQIKPAHKPWVGSLTGIFRDVDTGRLKIASCEHVLTAFGEVPLGTAVMHPSDGRQNAIAVIDFRIPRLVGGARNIVDGATAVLDTGAKFLGGLSLAIDGGKITGMRRTRRSDINKIARKPGRTTGTTSLQVRAINVSNYIVSTARGFTHFDKHIRFLSLPGKLGSLGGDSGVPIYIGSDFIGVLDSGGPNGDGRDMTGACEAVDFCDMLGIEPILIG